MGDDINRADLKRLYRELGDQKIILDKLTDKVNSLNITFSVSIARLQTKLTIYVGVGTVVVGFAMNYMLSTS